MSHNREVRCRETAEHCCSVQEVRLLEFRTPSSVVCMAGFRKVFLGWNINWGSKQDFNIWKEKISVQERG